MANIIFDEETYEQDLALMMLDVLLKKNEISLNTYNSLKKEVTKEVKWNELCSDGTTKLAG